jgi:hypothetical protein
MYEGRNFEGEEDVAVWSKTRSCACFECGDPIVYTEEVFLLSVMRTRITGNGLVYDNIVVDDMSDLLYEPILFCVGCWETVSEELAEQMADAPPITDDYSIIDCVCCGSSIRTDEVLGVCTFGEVHLSRRAPNGIHEDVFENVDANPIAICLGCLNTINQAVTLLWGDDEDCPVLIQQQDECLEGIYARCWRAGCCADADICGGCK